MKYNFTLLTMLRSLLIAMCCITGAAQALAQTYTASTVQTGGRYTAVASDNNGNLYVIRAVPPAYTTYQLEKWAGGNPGSSVVLHTGLNSALAIYPTGIAVNSSNGDVFVINHDVSGTNNDQIIRIPGGVPGTGTVVQSGRFFAAICLLNGTNNLVTLEWDNASLYIAKRYSATGGGSAAVLFSISSNNDDMADITIPTAMAVDQDNNIYINNSYSNSDENTEAGLIKFWAPVYDGTMTNVKLGRHISSVYFDANNVAYTIEQAAQNSANYIVKRYTDLSQSGVEIYPAATPGGTQLSSGFGEYPWGITSMPNGDIYLNDGFSTTPANGRLLKLAASNIHIVSINRLSPTSTSTNASSVQFLVTFDGPANGVSASNFNATVAAGSITGMTIDQVTGSGNTRVVTINTGTGNGVLRLDMVNVSGITPTVGNTMPYTLGQTYLIDKIAPSGTVNINGGANYTNTANVSLNLNAADGGGSGGLTMAISQDGINFGAFGPYASPVGYALNGPDGPKTVYIRLRDEAGNEADIQDDIILDRAAPETEIVNAPPNPANTFDASFNFTSDDPGATFEYQLDGSPFFPVTSPFNVFGLPAGTHTFTVRAKDLAGNVDPTPETYTWTIDTGKPSVTSVGAPANGTYIVGQQMNFTVTFHEAVVVDATGGIPYITLNIGSTTRNATYVSGSNTPNLVFRYTVAAGDVDADGIQVSGPISLNGGIIKDVAGNEAILTLNTVGNTDAVLVDGVGPTVTNVEAPGAGTYTLNENLLLAVVFDEHIVVTGSPSIPITIGSKTVNAVYANNPFTPPNIMIFAYVIQAGDMDDDGIAPGSVIELNGGSIKDAAGNNAVLTLNNVENTSGVLVNTKQPVPTISSAATTPVTGAFTITITFDDDVTDLLASHFNAVGVTLSNVTRTGTNTFTALVTPPSGEQSGNGSVTIPADKLQNIAGNPNLASNTYSFTWDTKVPTVTVTPPSNGTYIAGDVLTFTITYDEDVAVTGTPTLPITIGSTIRQAAYSAGGDARTLIFSYTVVNGEQDHDGIDRGPINLNGGTIRDLAGNNAPHSVANHHGSILVDGLAPTVTSVTVPANGYYKTGNTLDFVVNTSENVVVVGNPTLGVNIGGVIRQAAYKGGTGTNSLLFQYPVVTGDNDMDGIALVDLQLNGGKIWDAVGNNMVLTLNNVASTANVFVNTNVPTVTVTGAVSSNSPWTMTITFSEAVTGFALTDINATNATLSAFSTSDNMSFTVLVTPGADGQVSLGVPANVATNIGGNGNAPSNTLTYLYDGSAPAVTTVNVPVNSTYKAGDVLEFTVQFNEDVKTNGNPSFPIIIGSATRQATYSSGSGTNSLVFRYTVQDGELDTDGIAVGNTINLNGGYITDISLNDALLALNNAGNTSAVLVDAVAPVVTSVSVPANGYYRGGQQLNFTVHFSENVTPSGVPSIPITIGTTVVNANYNGSGSGTTALGFTYTVQPGDTDTDGITVGNTIALNPGTIKDGAGNDAVLALNNVANTSNVFVLTERPTVTFSGMTANNAAWTATFVFSHEVTGFTIDDIALTNAVASNFQVVSGTTYTALISPQVQGQVSIQVPADIAQDLAGNKNLASSTLFYLYDPNPPYVTSVEVPANGYYKLGDVLNFAVNWNEIVRVNATPSTLTLPVIIGSKSVQAAYINGFNTQRLTFAYTVQAGDLDLDGIQLGTALQMTRTDVRFTDLSNNPAILTLNNVPNTSGIFVHTGRPSVTLSSAADARVNAPFTVTATFNEEVTQLAAGDFTVTNATVSNLQTSDNITYTLTVTPAADGAVTISLPENVVENIVNNGNTASNSISRNYDGTAPVISAASLSVLENSAVGTAVGTLSASDASGTIENWTIVSDGAFTIDQNGKITVNDMAKLNSHAGTTVTVTVTVSDGLNTSVATAIDIEVLAVNRPPTLDPIDNVSLCANTDPHIMQLTGASAVEPHQTYSFSVASNQDYFDVLTVNASGLLTYQLKPSVSSGIASVTVTIKDDGGTANGGVDTFKRAFTITVNSLPVVTITSDKGNTVSKGDTIRLTATGGATYNWADVSGIISGQNSAVLTTRVQDNTTYTVTAISAAGCRTEATINIAALEDFKVDATNILTPNGDGRNDRFVIRNLDVYPDNEVRIFDRAGRLVYQQRNYNNTWDGTINGRPLAEGTYYYILTIQGGKKTAKGFITIIRDRY